MAQDLSFIKKMTPEQAAKYYKNRKSTYRRLLSKFTSLLRFFFGKSFRSNVATASEVKVREVRDGSGGGGSSAGYGLSVQKLKIPGKRQLQKNLDALEMRGAIDELDAIIDQCSATENAGMKALVKDMIANRNALAEVYTEALHAMSEMSENFIPDEVGDLFKRIQKYFDSMEKNHVEARGETDENEDELAYYINVGTKDGGMDFVLNCDITHWRNVTEGFHKALCVVVTVRVEPNESAFSFKSYVNILDRVALPYLYNLGSEITGENTSAVAKNFVKNIDREIARHNVVLFATKADLNLDATEVQTRLSKIEGVSGVVVEPNEVVLEFPDDNREIQTEVMKVLGNLREVKALVKKGYTQSLRNIDLNVHSYSLTLK
uniref:Uncharacterized protein n=1 Tax=Pseudomonas phage HRDY3 TaxID=3236930 RepID=A0AB39CDX6_9VIRU